jgi:hypothetical protein
MLYDLSQKRCLISGKISYFEGFSEDLPLHPNQALGDNAKVGSLLKKYPDLVNDIATGGAQPLHMCGECLILEPLICNTITVTLQHHYLLPATP